MVSGGAAPHDDDASQRGGHGGAGGRVARAGADPGRAGREVRVGAQEGKRQEAQPGRGEPEQVGERGKFTVHVDFPSWKDRFCKFIRSCQLEKLKPILKCIKVIVFDFILSFSCVTDTLKKNILSTSLC